MKYSLTGQQAFYFEKNGYIEFEHLLDDNEIKTLFYGIKGAKQDRNLSATNPAVRKIVFSTGLAELASRLAMKKKLRFGFDQVVANPVVANQYTVASCSCIAPLSLCLLLCVDGEQEPGDALLEEGIDPFPSKAGNGVFFLPNRAWNTAYLERHKNQTFMLIAYADEKVQYLYCIEDPYLHDLKRNGLVFGDQLPQNTHPFLCR